MDGIKLAVFDLDGTLNKTELHSVPAQTQVLAEFGAPPATPEKIKSTFGATYKEYTQRLLPGFSDEVRWQYLKRVVEVENEFLLKYGQTYEGVVQMLDELHKKNIKTAVCSNASLRYIECVLNALKIADKIDYIQPLMENCTKKETLKVLLGQVEPLQAVMVGDTGFDMEAAQANNIPFIGCLYGYRPQEIKSCEYTVQKACELTGVIGTVFDI